MAAPGIRRIAVIGAGDAGRAFALRSAAAGFDTILEDVMPSRLRRAQEAASPHAHLTFAATVEDAVRSADLAIDFVPDELESKLEIFSLLDRMAPPHTILLTPSTALSIADLASCTYRPSRCFALSLSADTAHLTRTSASSPEVTDALATWLRALGFAVTESLDAAESMLTQRPDRTT